MTVQDQHVTASEPDVQPELGGYRLKGTPRRREGGSLLFAAVGPDGGRVDIQVTAEPLLARRFRARMRKLARARADLDHPALLPVRSFGEERGRLYVVTDPQPAGSLVELLRTGSMDPHRALGLLRSAAEGLAAGHKAGLVHLALGAESLLLDGERLQLDLFGIFRATGQAGWGDVVRRDPHLRYESPEGVRGEELTIASNVYSLTALLVHALTGAPPFDHKDPMLLQHAHLAEPPPAPSKREPRLQRPLDEVVARGMAKDPAERPATVTELIAQAERALGEGGSAGAAAGSAGAAARWPRREPAPAPVAPVPMHREPEAESPPVPVPVDPEPGTAAPPTAQIPLPAPTSPPPSAPPGEARTVLDAWLAASAAAAPADAAPTTPLPKVADTGPAAPPPAPRSASPWDAGTVVAQPARPTAVIKPPLGVRLRRLLPLLAVVVVAAAFGAIVGLPGSTEDEAPRAARSPDAGTVARLDEVRARLRDDLAAAATPEEQAGVAERLADAHATAAAAARSSELKGAAENAVGAYSALAAAARSGDEDEFSSATSDVETADDVLGRALRSPAN